MLESEKITILEGPTPDFRRDVRLWNWGIYQTINPTDVVFCELRTGNGEAIRARCRGAWREGRPVQLDYPDDMRMRQYADVVALRLTEHEEGGTILNLWLYQPMSETEQVPEKEDSDDDDDEGFDAL